MCIININIDYREDALIKLIHSCVDSNILFKNIIVTVNNLSIGDIIISSKEKETDLFINNIIIERKTISDLMSSIKDGRYNEQSFRLNNYTHHNHNILYLIEGDINKIARFKTDKTNKYVFYSALFSLNYYKGFSTIRTFSIDETCIFICNTANKIRTEYYKKTQFYTFSQQPLNITKPQIENNIIATEDNTNTNTDILNNDNTDKAYISAVKCVKKNNITSNNIGEIMLCQIPGISAVSAVAILNYCDGSLFKLLKMLEHDINCLDTITYTTPQGKIRKINKNISTNIYNLLLKQ